MNLQNNFGQSCFVDFAKSGYSTLLPKPLVWPIIFYLNFQAVACQKIHITIPSAFELFFYFMSFFKSSVTCFTNLSLSFFTSLIFAFRSAGMG